MNLLHPNVTRSVSEGITTSVTRSVSEDSKAVERSLATTQCTTGNMDWEHHDPVFSQGRPRLRFGLRIAGAPQ